MVSAMRFKIGFLYVGLTAAGSAPAFPATECALEAAGNRVTRILFIGNSYTYYNNLPEIVEAIAEAADVRIESELIAAGGLSLADHAASEDVRSAIHEGDWDFVFLQEQSSFGEVFLVDGEFRVRPSTRWRSGAETLSRWTKESGATPVLLAHWAREPFPEDQSTIDRNVVEGAAAIGACFLRLSPARRVAEETLSRSELYDDDGSHPSPAASYLAAAVIVRALLPNGLTSAPPSVSGELIEADGGLRTGSMGTLVALSGREDEILTDAVNRTAKQAAEAPDGTPVEISLPSLPQARETPTAPRLRGVWEGEVALYPTRAVLHLDFRDEGAALHAGVLIRAGANERKVERTDVVLEGREIRFAFPQGPNGTTIHFVGVLGNTESLAGTAHFRSDSGDLEGYGSWRVRRVAE